MTAARVEATHAPVLVVDFGAQYAQLIARRVREAKVYSEIVPHTASVEAIAARQPAAVVLSGGPQSVYAEGAPQVDPRLFELGIPVFGICYGFQAMASALGGQVSQTGLSEFGRTPTTVTDRGVLLENLPESFSSWMSHGDSVTAAPEGFAMISIGFGLQQGSPENPEVLLMPRSDGPALFGRDIEITLTEVGIEGEVLRLSGSLSGVLG